MTERSATALLADETAIRRLVAFYCDAVSHRDPERAASIFAEDGVICIEGAELVGRAAIAEGMAQTFRAFALMQQVAHAGLIDVRGDLATARWSILELTIRTGATGLSSIFGTYEDELVRRDEGWRFARRTFRTAARALVETTKLKIHPEFSHALQFAI